MHFTIAASALLLLQSVVAIPSPKSHIVHEKRGRSSGWVKRDRISAEAVLPMRIGLKQSNLDLGHSSLMEISEPDSSQFAKHWTPEQVINTFAPSADTVAVVSDWLVKSGISRQRITHSENKAWLAFQASASEAERLLHTEYHSYSHGGTGQGAVACDQYHVPKAIKEHIDYITPGVKLLAATRTSPIRKRMTGIKPVTKIRPMGAKPIPSDLSTCDVMITPECVAALYEIPPFTGKPNPKNSMGLFEEGDYYDQEDLDIFFANQTPRIPQGTHPTPQFIDGAFAPVPQDEGGGESLLDMELSLPIIFPIKLDLYQTDDIPYATDEVPTQGLFNDWLDAIDGSYCTLSAFGETGNTPGLDPIYPDPDPYGFQGQLQCGIYKPARVISVSYGAAEADLPTNYQQRQCLEFMKLGLQGVTILFASGDSGVSSRDFDPAPNGCLGPNHTIFNPDWPGSCPYITTVGATKVFPGRTVFEPESAVFDPIGMPFSVAFFSGGGFSNIFGIPEYQAGAVATFFEKNDPPYPFYEGLLSRGNFTLGEGGGVYNRIGRGMPDVAANGDNIFVAVEGEFGLSGGTSASSPIFASIVTRINEERFNAGKNSIGFISPALYKNPGVLNDITNGSNPGCFTNGFSCAKGWDPVTGLGTPNFPRMLDLFMSLP